MALNNTNNYLTTLISAGNDALGHLYEVTFEGGNLTKYDTTLSVRCAGFKPPETTQDAYTVKYVTAFIDRPKTKIHVDRTFELKFRLDDNYILYRALLDQQKIMSNATKSFANSNITNLVKQNKLFNVHVNIVRELSEEDDHIPTRLFNFKNCWIESITPDSFSGENSDPISITCKINFLQMEDWQSGITGDIEHPNSLIDFNPNIKYD